MSDEWGSGTVLGIENVIGTQLNDSITGDHNANNLSGNSGDDTLNGRGGDDILGARGGSDTVVGGLDVDTVSYTAGHGMADFEYDAYGYHQGPDPESSSGGVIVDLAPRPGARDEPTARDERGRRICAAVGNRFEHGHDHRHGSADRHREHCRHWPRRPAPRRR
jgi:hypothetical protein